MFSFSCKESRGGRHDIHNCTYVFFLRFFSSIEVIYTLNIVTTSLVPCIARADVAVMRGFTTSLSSPPCYMPMPSLLERWLSVAHHTIFTFLPFDRYYYPVYIIALFSLSLMLLSCFPATRAHLFVLEPGRQLTFLDDSVMFT